MKCTRACCGFASALAHTDSAIERTASMRIIAEEGEKDHKKAAEIMVNAEECVHSSYQEEEEVPNSSENLEGGTCELVTLVGLLKACAMQKDLQKGNRAHADAIKGGLLENTVVCNSVVNLYAKCGALRRAVEVFDELRIRTLVSWNVLIAGFAQNGHAKEALSFFERMQGKGFSPDVVTFACILKACGTIGALDKGQEIHLMMVREGIPKTDIVAANALLDMYAKCDLLFKAEEVFHELPIRDVVSWTTLIGAYAEHGHGEEALHCFERMQQEGFPPNVVTFVCISRVCGMKGALDKGQEVHAQSVKIGMVAKSIVLGTALVDMYAKCGMLAKAEAVMAELPVRNVVSWTALITGYAQQGLTEKALLLYEQMQSEEVPPNTITFACILKVCSSLGAVHKAQQIHSELVKEDVLDESPNISTALLDTYAKSGMLSEARDVFDERPVQDTASWNALLAGYAQLGKDQMVFKLFNRMVSEGMDPDIITFMIVLNACSHRGLLDEGQLYYLNMSTLYGIIPTSDHHTCLIDLFASAGQMDKAVSMIMEMPFLTNATVWRTMLSACQKWRDMNVGSWAFEHAAQLDDNDAATYVLMSNIFVASG